HRREPLRGHEVPRLLRNPRRHHHAQGPPRHRVHHPGPRSGPPEGRADAALRQPDLQRLLVEPRAADAADHDRCFPGTRERRGAPEAVQGQRHRHRPQVRGKPVRHPHLHLRGRCRCLRPGRCRRLHQAERPAHAHRRQQGPLAAVSGASSALPKRPRRLVRGGVFIGGRDLSRLVAKCYGSALVFWRQETVKSTWLVSVVALGALLSAGCASESSRAVPVAQVATANQIYTGSRAPVAVGKFDNRSSYLRGIFSDGVDRLGSQAKTILITHLQQSNRFNVLERDNLAELSQEAGFKKQVQHIRGADYIITGDVTEFGRKEVGDHQLWGLLGRGKKQIAYAKVSLNVVNIATSEVVYSSQGAGEYELSNREIIGFGGTASYDSTLNGTVLDLAMREAVQGLVLAIDRGVWRP